LHFLWVKDLNDLLQRVSTPNSIRIKDNYEFHDEQEFMKEYYPGSGHKNVMNLIVQYFKYHNNIPRMFIAPQMNIYTKFFDKHRKVKY